MSVFFCHNHDENGDDDLFKSNGLPFLMQIYVSLLSSLLLSSSSLLLLLLSFVVVVVVNWHHPPSFKMDTSNACIQTSMKQPRIRNRVKTWLHQALYSYAIGNMQSMQWQITASWIELQSSTPFHMNSLQQVFQTRSRTTAKVLVNCIRFYTQWQKMCAKWKIERTREKEKSV